MTSTEIPSPRPPLTRFFAPLVALVFIIPIALSKGFNEADEINHFLIAREALHTWTSRLDIWGRPGCTLLFAPFTPLGLTGTRLFAAAITLLVCHGAVRLGRILLPQPATLPFFERHRDFFLFLLPFAAPAFLISSASVMTEMLLALAWTWAAVALASRRPLLASILVGLGGLARPEGFFAIAAWPVVLSLLVIARVHTSSPLRILRHTLLAGMPVFLWYLAGIAVYHSARWPLDLWPWQVHSQYGASAHRFLVALMEYAGIFWITVLLGTVFLITQRRWRALLFLGIPAASLILLHAILGSLGLFGSLPMPRYFISIGAFLAVLAVCGLSWLSRLITGPLVAALTFLALATVIVFPFLRIPFSHPIPQDDIRLLTFPAAQYWLPISMPNDGALIDAAVDGLPAILPPNQWNEHAIAFHPYARYRLGIAIQKEVYSRSKDRAYLANAPVGTVVISDDQLCRKEGLPQAADFLEWGYTLDPALQERIDRALPYPPWVHVYVWIKTAPATPAAIPPNP